MPAHMPGRIVVVHRPSRVDLPAAMDRVRVIRMSEALARRGHEVDVVRDVARPRRLAPRLREIPMAGIDWHRYDVVKTLFHAGYEALEDLGGAGHPFIVAKLGSVVGAEQTPGVYFFGEQRQQLYAVQCRLAERARFVTILTEPSALLWRRTHRGGPRILMVPTGVEARLPHRGPDPYAAAGIRGPVVLFAGNIYDATRQPEVNRVWQDRLNRVGRSLRRRGLSLVAMGYGDTSLLDARAVTHVGPIAIGDYWDWQRGASVGIVLAQGPVQDNESSKIYYYLRTGLPVVSERTVPNAALIEETGCGALVDLDDTDAMADAAAAFAAHPPRRSGVSRWMIRHHSWDVRAATYDPVIAEAVATRRPGAQRKAS